MGSFPLGHFNLKKNCPTCTMKVTFLTTANPMAKPFTKSLDCEWLWTSLDSFAQESKLCIWDGGEMLFQKCQFLPQPSEFYVGFATVCSIKLSFGARLRTPQSDDAVSNSHLHFSQIILTKL